MRLVKLKQVIEIYPSIFELTLQLPDNSDFAFTSGQFIDLTIPGLVSDPRGNHREFTIFSTPKELPIIKIAFRQTGSIFKKYLIANQGSQIELAGPYGDFILPKTSDTPIYLLAGGIGITPFMSILANQPQITLKLFWSNKDKIEPWLNKLKQFAKDLPAFNFNWQTGRLDLKQIAKEPDCKMAKFYTSGPIGLVVDIKKSLINAGVQTDKIFTDEFTGY